MRASPYNKAVQSPHEIIEEEKETMRPTIKIPQDAIEANGIEFDHVMNEYNVHFPNGTYINIPSNATEFSTNDFCYDILMGNVVLSLPRYSWGVPQITVLPFESR